jgi:glycosyltransferase involved in cell wall biosynthesis
LKFSIIICAYNPKNYLLDRLLNSIISFDKLSPFHEVIIVDNNSKPTLSENNYINKFLKCKANSQIIVETKAGLTAARIAGIKKSKYDWIVFFDDDNVPDVNYLLQAKILINNHPQVGAWGPGQLTVSYINCQDTKFLKKVKWLFQERHYNETFFENNTIEGSEYYPFGTGMIIRKEALDEYKSRVETGRYTMSDRNGKSLMSAGDTQILFTSLQMGYYAGSSNLLKLVHLIDATKAKHMYAVKLIYALNSSQLKAYQEVFYESIQKVDKFSNNAVIKNMYSALRLYKMHKDKYTLLMFMSKKLGELNARIIAYGLRKPFLLNLFETLFFDD